MNLQTDTYYRGYRLSEQPEGQVIVYYGTDQVDICDDLVAARKQVDQWLWAV